LQAQPGSSFLLKPAKHKYSRGSAAKGLYCPQLHTQNRHRRNVHALRLKGQAVLVNIWATWCPPCKAEMPAIENMYNEYKDQGFIVLAVNSTYQDNPLEIVPFIDEYTLTFPILLDETGDVSRNYQVRSLPSSYFINRLGIITEVVIGGPMSEALLRTRIEEALK
jgi:cytochrome c biogenesis protein CcmG, thiol:disulfide interchange protein DsbE